ncbi:ribosomal small subunit pseudouridine synthase A protein [Alicycliphilus sp. B1]|nr:ribosomal small subunit pseudouridine synthase A protein [Alicycliphilus sp. B1]
MTTQTCACGGCVQRDAHRIDLTLTEGKYHQVKRMIAAVGNRVEALHRARIGGLELPADMAPGQWRWLGLDELALLK